MNKKYTLKTLLLLTACGWTLGASAQTTTFSVPGVHSYTVGAGVIGLQVDMKGATGGTSSSSTSVGGNGGRVQCELAVTAGQVLQMNVGGRGVDATVTAGGAGGINGGGNGELGYNPYAGAGGGGA